MERPTTLKVMTRVMDAVTHLHESKGSTIRGILDFIRQNSRMSNKNLTLQVHKALRNAVNAGLLRHRNGRYKAMTILNPISPQEHYENHQNDESVQRTIDRLEDHESKVEPSRKIQETAKRRQSRNLRRKSRGRQRKNRQRRRGRRREVTLDFGAKSRRRLLREHPTRGLFQIDPFFRENIENEADSNTSSHTDHRRNRSISIKSVSQSDLSGCDVDSGSESRKSHGSRRTLLWQDTKHSEAKSRGSTSRNPSPLRRSREREQNESQFDQNEIDRSRQDQDMECEESARENEASQ